MKIGTRVPVRTTTGVVGALSVVGTFPGAVLVEVERLEPRGATDHRAWIDLQGRLVKIEHPLTPCDLELLAAGVHALLEAPTREEIPA